MNHADPILLARKKLSLELRDCVAAPGDHILNPGQISPAKLESAKPAAVLIGLIARPEGPAVLLTTRASALRAHSGQIAFPGGRIDLEDAGPVAAALREAHEEVGLDADHVEPFGLLDPYISGSGYRITPVVAQLHPPFALMPNPDEVADIFEAPLDFLMDPHNHQQEFRLWKGIERRFYAMTWQERYIWGVTAGILRNFYERLYS